MTESTANPIQISLHRRTGSSLSQYQTTCISKHYALNNQILAAFESHYRNGLFQVAFHLGLKFCETALLEIPKHGYFYSMKHEPLRIQSSFDAIRVTHLLQEIIAKVPEVLAGECHKIERLNHLANQQHEHLRDYECARKMVERELAVAYGKEVQQRRNSARSKSNNSHNSHRSINSDSSFTSTLLACGDSFSSVFCPGATTSLNSNNNLSGEYKTAFPEGYDDDDGPQYFPDETRQEVDHRYPPAQRSKQKQKPKSSRPSLIDNEIVIEEEKGGAPPSYKQPSVGMGIPISDQKQPPPPTSSSSHPLQQPLLLRSRTNSDYDLQRALFVSGLQVELPTKVQSMNRIGEQQQQDTTATTTTQTPFAPPGAKKRESTFGVPMDMLAQCYHEDFDALRTSSRVRINQVATYQGRVPDSTNGCTVIAPLLCIHHFHNTDQIPDPGLPDQIIVQVIDEETPNILPLVRETLGLVPDAFLIPADAHESLMKQSYMCQEQFMSVCGGNILAEDHLDALLEQLNTVHKGKKLAATFFFHEHVITVLQLRRGRLKGKEEDEVWFDVIDSLPHADTLRRPGETTTVASPSNGGDDGSSRGRSSSEREFSQRTSENTNNTDESCDDNWDDLDMSLLDHIPPSQAARIRCSDAEALKATLKWYACSVFTAENRAYIDTYQWDENLCDFDPRVFQAFLWTSV